jgi:hypothetical protein
MQSKSKAVALFEEWFNFEPKDQVTLEQLEALKLKLDEPLNVLTVSEFNQLPKEDKKYVDLVVPDRIKMADLELQLKKHMPRSGAKASTLIDGMPVKEFAIQMFYKLDSRLLEKQKIDQIQVALGKSAPTTKTIREWIAHHKK